MDEKATQPESCGSWCTTPGALTINDTATDVAPPQPMATCAPQCLSLSLLQEDESAAPLQQLGLFRPASSILEAKTAL